ncbi:hypothetical protein O181_087837 [Austropuccinia psidii MF-1]|uniref:Uncharacterized protein n=1 Tax=Austropuccinia psidii MF-1 TaxID=1389203 RepID=A0A9Q3P3X3_9BASI|nr:hypothetical protein [Austropuccinia psidii MF-1]
MEHGKQEIPPSIPPGRTWSKVPEDMSQRDIPQRSYGNHQRMESHQEFQTPGGEGNQDKGESRHYRSYRRKAEPERAYYDSFPLTRSRPTQLSSGFTPFRNHQITTAMETGRRAPVAQISGKESPFFTIPGSFQEKKSIQGQRQDFFHPKAERVGPNDTEAVGLGERSEKEPEIAVNMSRISSPTHRKITPTQNEHNVVTPESNLNSDELWLQMSQFAEQTQKRFQKSKKAM